MRKITTALLLAGSSLLTAGTAHAQSEPEAPASAAAGEDPSSLSEIIVTARRRTESLQNVPVSISAISQEALSNNLANDLTKVAELAPQVMIGASSTGTGAVITIRGISSSPSNAGLDQSVAVSVDGVVFSRGRIIQAAMFDLDRVEVMQGPQALFFGKNSPAGVIALNSANPTSSLKGYLRTGYEFVADEKYVEAAISGPLTNTLNGRFAMRAADIEGWMKNVAAPIADPFTGLTAPGAAAGRRQPNGRDIAGRLSLDWEPTNDFSAKLRVTLNKKTENGGASNTEPYCVGSTTTPVTMGNVPLPGADCQKDRVRAVSALAPELAVNYPYSNGGVPYYDSKLALASLTMEKKLDDNVSLTTTTGYYRQSISDADSYDWTPYNLIFSAEHETYEMVSQELRLESAFEGPLNFMAGGYFERSTRYWFNAPDLFNLYNSVSDNFTSVEGESRSRNTSYSFFGQLRWSITPSLELAGGARYTRDNKRTRLENLSNNPLASAVGIFPYPQNQPLSVPYERDNVSPEATLTWRVTPDQTLYAGYKTGYKAGGISNPAIFTAADNADTLTFDEEKVAGFEVGYKGRMLDNRLRVSLTAYQYTYKGLQVVAYDVDTISFLLRNAARARTRGISGQVEFMPVIDFIISGAFGYNEARYLSFPGAQCYSGQTAAEGCIAGSQDLAGKPLVRSPKFTGNIGANYTQEVRNWKVNASVNAAYSSAYETIEDLSPGTRQKAFWRLNAALHMSPADEAFRISLIGRNLTNSYYLTRSFGWSGSLNPEQFVGNFNRPREVALQAEVRF